MQNYILKEYQKTKDLFDKILHDKKLLLKIEEVTNVCYE